MVSALSCLQVLLPPQVPILFKVFKFLGFFVYGPLIHKGFILMFNVTEIRLYFFQMAIKLSQIIN